MASVTFSSAVGGDNSVVTDDANPTTGLANYGYVDRLVPAFGQIVNVAAYTVSQAVAAAASQTAAAASAASAVNAPGTNATSTTSLAIGTGSKTFTIQTGKAYVVGQTLVAASAADPAFYMTGQVTAHNSGTGSLTILVSQIGTAGTRADWVISMGALVSTTLPSMTGNSGRFLTNNGTVASWAAALVPANDLSDLASASTARTNLGLAIGTNVQAFDAGLLSIAGLTTAADRMIYTTASDVYAVTTLTAFGRSLIDDADATAGRATLGLVIGTNVQAFNSNLAALSGLTLAADKLIYATGAAALAQTDLTAFARTILDDANAGAVRATIGAAASGANTDITSLGGLTTPLSVAQGGTGSTTGAVLPGSVLMYAANAAPAGWLECNGAAVSRTTFAALFAAVGTTFGVGDGSTTFNVPEMRGEFARGWDNGRGIDTGRAFGSAQAGAVEAHTHSISPPSSDGTTGQGNTATGIGGSEVVTPYNTGSTGGTETRPRNIALMFIIKT